MGKLMNRGWKTFKCKCGAQDVRQSWMGEVLEGRICPDCGDGMLEQIFNNGFFKSTMPLVMYRGVLIATWDDAKRVDEEIFCNEVRRGKFYRRTK